MRAGVHEADLATTTTDEVREAVRRDLRYWHTRQITAEIAPSPGDDMVAIDSRVRFRLNGHERHIDIVGHDETARLQRQGRGDRIARDQVDP